MTNEETALDFLTRLSELTGGVQPDERLILQCLPGDPGQAKDVAWRPRPWRPEGLLPASPERTNGYVAISSFGRAPDGSFRRQKALFKSCRMIMVDDVGTKVPVANAAKLSPTWKVLTSPGNEQWLYLLHGGDTHRELVDAVLNGLVAQALLPKDDKDPGMKGVTRVARIPGFINGKAAYGGNFRVQWTQTEGNTYNLMDLVKGFGLTLEVARPRIVLGPERNEDSIKERAAAFKTYFRTAQRYGLTGPYKSNAAGWQEVRCPWENEHSNSKAGADIRLPAEENEYYGSFKCHHGHCEGKGWRQFTDYLDSLTVTDIDAANESWRQFEDIINDGNSG